MAKFEEIKELFRQLLSIEEEISCSDYHPGSEVRFGCDCGCGGDAYDLDSWAALGEEYGALVKELGEVEDQLKTLLSSVLEKENTNHVEHI